jgi:hypothetical protein
MKIKLLLFMLLCSAAVMAKDVKLTIKWTFTNVVEGYDHDNKMVVFVDGKRMGESAVFKQTAKASYEVMVSEGVHQVKVENMALYEGKWEAHTRANSYSVDALYEGEVVCGAKTIVNLVFDIDSESTNVNITGAGKNKGAAGTVPLAITWKFTNVIDGYDHQNRIQVYVDGKLVGTSQTGPQSKQMTYTVNVPAGSHDIAIENYALYEGEWELHSRENDYSIDAFYATKMSFKKKKKTVNMIFDISTEEATIKVK